MTDAIKTLNGIAIAAIKSIGGVLSASAIKTWNGIQLLINDPQWANVSLLLHGDGTNGAQNNTFLDSSTNNFTITRNGNTTQGSFSPFSITPPYSTATRGGSGYFDGTGDYLSVADNAALELGSGNWTIECWVYTSNSTAYSAVLTRDDGGNTAGSYVILLNGASANGFISFWSADVNGFSTVVLQGSIKCNDSAWHHVAIVRNSNTLTLYIDGVSNATATYSGAFGNTAQPLLIGSETGYSRAYTGYISNVRYVIGTAVYTAAFTPPTAPLTAITNTQLLLNYTNAGIYDNAMLNDLETVGNAQVSTSVVKYGTGSMAFNGTNSKLTGATSTALNMGSGDFTVECWSYWAGTSTLYQNFVGSNSAGFSGNATFFRVWGTSAGGLANKVGIGNPTHDATSSVYSVNSLAANTWTHVAATRSSGIIRVFINGTLERTGSSDTSTYDFGDNGICVGQSPWDGANGWYSGNIDDLRITKGYARYTANFTPPTAAFPNLGSTSILPTSTAAPGIWTLDQAMQNIKAGTWPLPH